MSQSFETQIASSALVVSISNTQNVSSSNTENGAVLLRAHTTLGAWTEALIATFGGLFVVTCVALVARTFSCCERGYRPRRAYSQLKSRS
jgi:hypothetical protein